MVNYIKYWFEHYVFWLIYFLVFRIAIVISVNPFEGSFRVTELMSVISKGYRLDISVASYLFIVPFVLLLINLIVSNKNLFKTLKTYHLIVSGVLIILSISNIIIFKYWGTLINTRALSYVLQPKEMLASASNSQLVFILITYLVLFYISVKLYNRFVLKNIRINQDKKASQFAGLVITLVITGIGIRGGVQQIPINESTAVFSHNVKLNQIAINPMWYLGHNLHQSGMRNKNPYHFTDNNKAKIITNNLLEVKPKEKVELFQYSTKPNIVIILLESWTADIINDLGGLENITPGFHQLCKEGLLFSNIYSSGFRTDQALISALSGFPAQPNNSIIRFPAKAQQLPSIANELKKIGYINSFYYGGDLTFANMNNYLINSGYNKIISESDFSSENKNSKWGAHDEFIFEKQIQDLNYSATPFFSTLLTLSTHEPFEVPSSTPFNGKSESELFKKAAWYTDQCLHKYFVKISRTKWYQNTIFFLLADHGHRLPMERGYFVSRSRQIPLLIFSPLLKEEFRGQKNNTLANQHDLPATLLNSIGIPNNQFYWSNDILNDSRNNYAYISYDNAITWITDSTEVFIPLQEGIEAKQNTTVSSNDTIAKAFLQQLYHTFLSY